MTALEKLKIFMIKFEKLEMKHPQFDKELKMLTVNIFNHEYSINIFPKTSEKAKMFLILTTFYSEHKMKF